MWEERPDVIFEWDSKHGRGPDKIRLRNIWRTSAFNVTIGPFSWPEVTFTIPLEINVIHPNEPETVCEPHFDVKFPSGVTEIGYMHLVLRDRRFSNRQPLQVRVSFSDQLGNSFARQFTLEAGAGSSYGPDVRITPGQLIPTRPIQAAS